MKRRFPYHLSTGDNQKALVTDITAEVITMTSKCEARPRQVLTPTGRCDATRPDATRIGQRALVDDDYATTTRRKVEKLQFLNILTNSEVRPPVDATWKTAKLESMIVAIVALHRIGRWAFAFSISRAGLLVILTAQPQDVIDAVELCIICILWVTVCWLSSALLSCWNIVYVIIIITMCTTRHDEQVRAVYRLAHRLHWIIWVKHDTISSSFTWFFSCKSLKINLFY